MFFVALSLVFFSCSEQPKQQKKVVSVTCDSIPIKASADATADTEYMEYLAPTKAFVDKEMKIIIGYAADSMWVGGNECPMLNWATDALYEAAKAYYAPNKVDVAIVNMGSMRKPWPKGEITLGKIFKLMPFDNKMVLLRLKGTYLMELCDSFAQHGGQGVAGMRVHIKGKKVVDVTVDGQPVDTNAYYIVATNNYLAGGKDYMEALTHYEEMIETPLLIRDIYREAVEAKDTIHAAVDGRMLIEP